MEKEMPKDTLFPDLSEHNDVLNDQVATKWNRWSRWIAIRANDGSHLDLHYIPNLAWVMRAINMFKLIGYVVYTVYPSSFEDLTPMQAWGYYKQQLAKVPSGNGRRRRQVRLIDIETWSGKYHGDHSASILAFWNIVWRDSNNSRPAWQRKTIGIKTYCQWLDQRRTPVYGNAGDLDELFPRNKRPRNLVVFLANYTANPPYPGKVVHQFSSNYPIPGLGSVDINTADGYSPQALGRTLGISTLTIGL
jgi:hypothetical protein